MLFLAFSNHNLLRHTQIIALLLLFLTSFAILFPTFTFNVAADMASSSDRKLSMHEVQTQGKALINRKRLLNIVPLSERTILNMEKRGEFPKRFAITSRAVAWDLQEVEAWMDQQKNAGRQCAMPQLKAA